jgi:predicted DNA-binding transcriptional regulator AlpA
VGVIAGPRPSVELARETASAWHGGLPGETIMNVDTEDLIDAAGVAQLLGLARRTSVSVYQQRYPDMPRPIVDLGAGRSRLWSRRAILSWLPRQTDGSHRTS